HVAPKAIVVDCGGARLRLERHDFEYVPGPSDGAEDGAHVRISIEPFRSPWHQLPDADGTRTILVRSAYLPFELRDTQAFGAFERRVPDVDSISSAALVRILQGVFAKREFYPSGTAHPRGQE